MSSRKALVEEEKETNPGSVCDDAVWEWREAFWGPCGRKGWGACPCTMRKGLEDWECCEREAREC